MKNKLILLLILSFSIFAYFDVYATNGYREIYSPEYYENTDGENFIMICVQQMMADMRYYSRGAVEKRESYRKYH